MGRVHYGIGDSDYTEDEVKFVAETSDLFNTMQNCYSDLSNLDIDDSDYESKMDSIQNKLFDAYDGFESSTAKLGGLSDEIGKGKDLAEKYLDYIFDGSENNHIRDYDDVMSDAKQYRKWSIGDYDYSDDEIKKLSNVNESSAKLKYWNDQSLWANTEERQKQVEDAIDEWTDNYLDDLDDISDIDEGKAATFIQQYYDDKLNW